MLSITHGKLPLNICKDNGKSFLLRYDNKNSINILPTIVGNDVISITKNDNDIITISRNFSFSPLTFAKIVMITG